MATEERAARVFESLSHTLRKKLPLSIVKVSRSLSTVFSRTVYDPNDMKLVLALAAGLFVTGCYNDFDNPTPAKVYTDQDFTEAGAKIISIKELKQYFYMFGTTYYLNVYFRF